MNVKTREQRTIEHLVPALRNKSLKDLTAPELIEVANAAHKFETDRAALIAHARSTAANVRSTPEQTANLEANTASDFARHVSELLASIEKITFSTASGLAQDQNEDIE
jgi:hypothetical protein